MDIGFEVHVQLGSQTFDADDASMLRAIEREGSLNAAANSLNRSYSRVQKRVKSLEAGLGPLVERRRGGEGGGGSSLTSEAREVLTQFDRLQAALTDTAEKEEVVITGTVVSRNGELATIETPAGPVRALLLEDGPIVHITLKADAITLHRPDSAPEPRGSSARNRFEGTVDTIQHQETIGRVAVDINDVLTLPVLVTNESLDTLSISSGDSVVATFKATATRATPA